MPVCPYCSQDITTLYCSIRRILVRNDKKWDVDISDDETVIACSACREELGPKDLDELSVPSELR